jgi:hypothetical protein
LWHKFSARRSAAPLVEGFGTSVQYPVLAEV